MNQARKLVIISNEKISKSGNRFYCDNIDMKSIPEGLSKNFKVFVNARKSNIKRSHQISLEKIEIASNIFTFLFNIFKTCEIIKPSPPLFPGPDKTIIFFLVCNL